MSFSREVKSELIEVRLRREDDGAKLVCGAALAAASLSYSQKLRKWGLKIVSESGEVISFITKLALKNYELEQETVINRHERLRASNTELFLYGRGLESLMEGAGLLSYDENGEKSYDARIPEGLESDHAFRAFIRGMFLACGTVADPAKRCHIEFVLKNEHIARSITRLLAERGIPPKLAQRKSLWVVYIKNGDTAEDLLAFMGAGESMMAMSEQRLLREMRNNSTREINCFLANTDKSAKASAKQVEDIGLIVSRLGFDALSEELYEVAKARFDEPELSLSQLADKLGLGKSAVNYRLKKIAAIADDLRAEQEQ